MSLYKRTLDKIYEVTCRTPTGKVIRGLCMDCLRWSITQYKYTSFVVKDPTVDGLYCQRCKKASPAFVKKVESKWLEITERDS